MLIVKKSAKGSSACRRAWEPQLQQKYPSFSVEMGFQLQPKDAAFSMKCLAREALGSSARRSPMESQSQQKGAVFSGGRPGQKAIGSSAYMEQMGPILQQNNASFSAGMELQWQPKNAAFSVDQKHQTWGKDFEKEISQVDKETRSVIQEECKEFGRMFREKLQEFAMILIKKYHYNFPVEYFDNYHGSFNKEEFLGAEQPKEETRLRTSDSLLTLDFGQKNKHSDRAADQKEPSDLFEEEIISQDASTKKLQGNFREAIDEVIEEAKANLLPPIASAGAEGFGIAPDQKFVENGTTLDQTNQTKEPAIGVDDGAEAFPQILDLSKFEEQSHLGQNMDLTWVKIGNEKVKTALAGGKLRDIAEGIEGFAEENKTIAAVLVFAPTRKSKLLSNIWKDDLLAEIEVAPAPKANAHKQPWYECPRQICNLPLLHFKDADDIFQFAPVVHHGGVGTIVAGIEIELYQLAPIELLGRITTRIDLGYLRTRKKKRPRRTRKERKKNQIEKAGIG